MGGPWGAWGALLGRPGGLFWAPWGALRGAWGSMGTRHFGQGSKCWVPGGGLEGPRGPWGLPGVPREVPWVARCPCGGGLRGGSGVRAHTGPGLGLSFLHAQAHGLAI